MDLLIYIILILGSYSPGYGLVRAGFPLVQKKKLIEKIALGYVGGLVLFGIPFLILNVFSLKDNYYVIACIFVYFMLLLILLLKRTALNEVDPLTKEDLNEMNRNQDKSKIGYSTPVNYAELVKENKKEKLGQEELKQKPSNVRSINFDQGLMVKSRNKGEQVLKDENKNNISKNPSNEQKVSIMSKLREYAQDINDSKKSEKQKNKNREDDDLEGEDELMELIKEDD